MNDSNDYTVYNGTKLFHDRIYRTTDYEMFQYIPGNRDIDSNNVDRLVGSINRQGQIQPVLLDEKLFVIDGQNRIAACKELDIYVRFQLTSLGENGRLELVQMVNTVRKNWSWENYLKMYCVMGKGSYMHYKELLDRYKFEHTAMLAVVLFASLDGGAGSIIFKKGELKIKDLSETTERLNNIEDYWRFISRAYIYTGKKRETPPAKLIIAIVKIMKHENFEHKTMLKKLQNDVSGFAGINTINGFVDELVKIYNMRNQNKINFN